jgi:hypothetical protein
MAPSRVDLNKKQTKSSINQVEEDHFYLDRMARSVDPYPSHTTVDYVNSLTAKSVLAGEKLVATYSNST